MSTNGYVFIKNFFNPEEVIKARNDVIDFTHEMFDCVDLSEKK